MGGKKPLRRPLWPPTRATASNYYPLGLDGAGGAAKPLLRAPKKPAPLHGRLPAFSGAVDAFERARKCFLEWRYFFSIILSEFLKNRVALHFESRNRTKGVEVDGKTLGLIGCGHIGRLVAQKAALGFGMKVVGYDAYAKPENMPEYIQLVDTPEEVYRQADFLSLHVPLTPDTRDMVNKEVFAMMKPTAIVLNCARGGVINEADLYQAVVDGSIAGAGLDVFEDEPINPQNPLYTLDKVIVTPHDAALTFEAADRMGLHAAQGIVEVLQGKKATWPVNHLE